MDRPSQSIDALLRKMSSRRGLVLLGQFGIFLARKALRDKGFSIRDKTHRSYGSFLAFKNKRKFLVEVKTRLKYKGNNQIKKRYKLDSGWKGGTYKSASEGEFHFKAKAHWVAVQIDIEKDLYSVYFGSLDQLGGKSGIPMGEAAVSGYKCLANNQRLRKAAIAFSGAHTAPQRAARTPETEDTSQTRSDWSYHLLEAMRPERWAGLYVLGCFDGRITFYSQQVRALNLVRALFHLDVLAKDKQVAIVGAGAAGVTAAVAAARLGGNVALFEERDAILHLQATAGHRFIHPHLYDWPASHSEGADAGLPLMNWKANFADQVVRDQLRPQFEKEMKRCGQRLELRKNTVITRIQPRTVKQRFQIFWNNNLERYEADTVLLAIGFGVEDPLSYWSGDDLAGPHRGSVRRILISGTGDGGLVDLARAALRSGEQESEFRHDQAIKLLTPDADFKQLGNQMYRIDDEVRTQNTIVGGSTDLFNLYCEKLTVPERFLNSLRKLRRTDADVTLNFQNPGVFNLESSRLNRLLAFLLLKSRIVRPMQGKLAAPRARTTTVKVTDAGGHIRTEKFDLVVLRHGPEKRYFERRFPLMDQARHSLGGKLAKLELTGALGDTIEWYQTVLGKARSSPN